MARVDSPMYACPRRGERDGVLPARAGEPPAPVHDADSDSYV